MDQEINLQDEVLILGYFERLLLVQDAIIRQYTECIQVLNDLFREYPETKWFEDKIGTCNVTRENAEYGLRDRHNNYVGPASPVLILMRDSALDSQKNEEGMKPHGACPYHDLNNGCVLGDLKSPICVAFYRKGELLPIWLHNNARFHVMKTLETILLGSYDPEKDEFSAENNWRLVDEFKQYIENIRKAAKSQKLEEIEAPKLVAIP